MDDLDNVVVVDPLTVTCLCDAGCREFVAAVGMDADGAARLVLARVDAIGDESVRYDPNCRAAEHEQLGQLPPAWRARVHRAPLRCGRPTLAGGHCRIPVGAPGQVCSWHRAS